MPLVLRAANGFASMGFGSQHAQAVRELGDDRARPEDRLAVHPGRHGSACWRPSIRDDDPVLVFEHKGLFAAKGEVPATANTWCRSGVANVVRPGTDVTLVGLSITVGRLPDGGRASSPREGIYAEVIDLRSLVPLDVRTVLALGGEDRRGSSSSRRTPANSAGAPRSPRSSPTRASTTCGHR